MKHLTAALILFAGCAAIAGCNGSAPEQTAAAPAAADAAQTPDTPAEATITTESAIWFEPESASACPDAEPVTGVVHWNASAFPGVTTVQVTMPAGVDEPEGMFAVSANVGQKETGPWLAAGTEFVLRDNANGNELARAKMPGAPCAQ